MTRDRVAACRRTSRSAGTDRNLPPEKAENLTGTHTTSTGERAAGHLHRNPRACQGLAPRAAEGLSGWLPEAPGYPRGCLTGAQRQVGLRDSLTLSDNFTSLKREALRRGAECGDSVPSDGDSTRPGDHAEAGDTLGLTAAWQPQSASALGRPAAGFAQPCSGPLLHAGSTRGG